MQYKLLMTLQKLNKSVSREEGELTIIDSSRFPTPDSRTCSASPL